MNRGHILLWSLGTVIAAAVAAYLVVRAFPPLESKNSEASFHDWLHENLEITAEQEKLLRPNELAFESKRRKQRAVIKAAGSDLATAIRSSQDANSPEVDAARRKLIEAQGELQRLTLDHFFTMKKHLSREQGEKLLTWTHDSIVDGYQH